MAGECLACNQSVLVTHKRIKCTKCSALYHTECVLSNISSQVARINWVCPTCVTASRKGGDNTNTPIRPSPCIEVSPMAASSRGDIANCSAILSELRSFRNDMQVRLDKQDEKMEAFSGAINCLQSEIFEMKNCFQSLRNDLDSVIECTNKLKDINNKNEVALKDTKNSIVDIKSQLVEHEHSLEFLSKKFDDLQVDSSQQNLAELKVSTSSLNSNLITIQNKVNQLEQISRSHNFELHAVPEKKDENLRTIVTNLFDKISVSLPEDIIISCYRVAKRVKSTDRPRTILITLMTPRHRDMVLSAVHRYNKANSRNMLNSHDLGVVGAVKQVYVAENLTPEMRHIFMEARQASRTLNYKFVWVKFGKVYMRKNEHSPAVLINNLDKIKSLS